MKRIALLILLIVIIAPLGRRLPVGAAAPAQPPAPSQLRLLDHMGGQPRQVVVRGTYAYVGAQYALEIFDVRDQANPAPVGRVFVEQPITGLAVANGYAYALSGDRLTAISVANPGAPAVVGACAACGGYGMSLDGTLATIRGPSYNHFFVSLADPRAPRVVGGGIYGESTTGHAVTAGTRAYHATPFAGCIPDTACFYGKLRILDISDLDNPRLLGEASIPGVGGDTPLAVAGGYAAVGNYDQLQIFQVGGRETPLRLGAAGAGGIIVDVASDGQRAVAVGETETGGFLAVFQINPASAPTRIGYLALPWKPVQLRAGGGWAYVTGGAAGLHIFALDPATAPAERAAVPGESFSALNGIAADPARGVMFATNGYGLQSIDAADPRRLRPLGPGISQDSGLQVALSGSTAFINTAGFGVHTFDVSQAAQPRFLARAELHTNRIAVGQTSGGRTLLYGADGSNLAAADVTDPAQPALLPAPPALGVPVELTINGSAAYVRTSDERLWVFDTAVAAVMKPVGRISVAGFDDIVIGNGHAYMRGRICPTPQTCASALRIVNLADPRAPAVTATYTGTQYLGHALFLQGSLLYLMDQGELRVFDVANPQAVAQAGSYRPATPGALDNLQRHGNYLYAHTANTLEIINLTNPITPSLAAARTFSRIDDLAVGGHYLHLLDGTDRVKTFDIADPANPAPAGGYTLLGFYIPTQIEAIGTTIVLGARDSNSPQLRVVNMANPAQPVLIGAGYPPSYVALRLTSSRLYVLTRDGLELRDMNRPLELPLHSSFATGLVSEVSVSGDYVFAHHSQILRGLDYSNPQAPAETDLLTFLNPPVSANPAPTRVVHSGGAALQVIDASDPGRLSRLSVTPFPAGSGGCANLVAKGSYLYAACYFGQVLVYDLSDPRQPALAASAQLPGRLRAIALLGGAIAVAGEGGLFTLSHVVVNHQTFLPGLER